MTLPQWTEDNPVAVDVPTRASAFAAVWNNVMHGLRSATSAATTPNDAASYPLANASKLTGVDTGAAERNLAHIDASDDVRLGDPAVPAVIQSAVAPTWYDGSVTRTLAISGSLDALSDTMTSSYTLSSSLAAIPGLSLSLTPGVWLIVAQVGWRVDFVSAAKEGTIDVEVDLGAGVTARYVAEKVVMASGGLKQRRDVLTAVAIRSVASAETYTVSARGSASADAGSPDVEVLNANTYLCAVRLST